MNRLNWIQQEQNIADYHVLTWKTSHFHHPRNRTDIPGAVGSKFDMNGGAASPGAQPQADGIGFGLTDSAENILWKTGGLGADGTAEDGVKNAKHQEAVAASDRTEGRQVIAPLESEVAEQVVTAAQSIVPEEVYSVLSTARQTILNVHDRMKQSAVKLRDVYQKHQKMTAGTPGQKGESRKQPEKEQRGTRKCDKNDMLSMQAHNHYLLDSYDRNGQYSMLGK